MKSSYLATLVIVTGCSAKSDEAPRPPAATAPVPAAPATPAAPREDLPAGWHRVDLQTLTPPLAVSVVIPEGKRVEMQASTCRDRDGLLFKTTEATIDLDDGSSVSLTPCQNMGTELTTLAAAKAAYSMGGNVKLGESEEAPTGEWALTLADPGGGFTVGWAPAARVMCQTQRTKLPDEARRICLGVRPAGKGFVAAPDPALNFPDEPDVAAREVLASLQRALARDDHDAFLALVDRHVEVDRDVDVSSRTALRVILEGDSLESVLGLSKCRPTTSSREPAASCQLRSGRRGDAIVVGLQDQTGGKWSSFELAKTPDGWRIVRITVSATT